MDFIVDYLKNHKGATYADVRTAAESRKMEVYPIMYGRAQALLGLVKSKPRGQGKAAIATAQKRAPARPAKTIGAAPSLDTGSLDGIIAAVRSSEQAKARYRSALEKIQSILGTALG